MRVRPLALPACDACAQHIRYGHKWRWLSEARKRLQHHDCTNPTSYGTHNGQAAQHRLACRRYRARVREARQRERLVADRLNNALRQPAHAAN